MATFLIKRIAQAVFVVLVVTLLVSYAIRLSGDPAIMLTQGAGSFTTQDLENIRRSLGLDRPFSAQYLSFLGGLLRGDFGRSFFGQAPVAGQLADAVQSTLLLTVTSLFLSILLSIPLGIHAAVHRGRMADQVIRVLSLVGLSFPNFWLAIMLVLVFAVQLNWLPASGSEHAANLIMPAGTMAVILAATTVRLVRTSMLETLSAQYIMVARSKGLRERVVLYKHALRNCAIPIITYIGVQFGNLIGNIVVIERVFAWPGLGSLAFDAVQVRDYPVLQGAVTVLALLIVSVNLLIDIVYGVVDPRIRTE